MTDMINVGNLLPAQVEKLTTAAEDSLGWLGRVGGLRFLSLQMLETTSPSGQSLEAGLRSVPNCALIGSHRFAGGGKDDYRGQSHPSLADHLTG